MSRIHLFHAGIGLQPVEAEAYRLIHRGDYRQGEPDIGGTIPVALTLARLAPGEHGFDVTLPGDSTLTIVLRMLS